MQNQIQLLEADHPLVGAPGTESAPGHWSEYQKCVEKVFQFKHNIQLSPKTLPALLICGGFWNGMSGLFSPNGTFHSWCMIVIVAVWSLQSPARQKRGKKKKKKRLFSGVNTLKGQEIHIHFLASRLDSIFRRQVEQKSLNIMLIQETLGNI